MGKSLPRPVKLLTPIGEFSSVGSGWDAVWSDPQIWDDGYRLPELKEREPWVTQIEDTTEGVTFLAKGSYRAPREVHAYGVPWTNQQLKDTPAHWVYIYRLSWPIPNAEYSSHAVTGYWVDPTNLDLLTWE